MANIKNKKIKHSKFINFSHELNLKNINGIENKLKKEMKGFKEFEINIKDVESMDISFLQLLYSMKDKLKKVNAEMPEHISSIISKAGLYQILTIGK